MGKEKEPVTQAVRELRAAGVRFQGHPYRYVTGGGTAQFASELGVDEHHVIKTLIMEDDTSAPMVMLMHGDRQVSVRELLLGVLVATGQQDHDLDAPPGEVDPVSGSAVDPHLLHALADRLRIHVNG